MYLSIFLEIENDGTPRYKKEYEGNIETGNVTVCTEEYAVQGSALVIPQTIVQEIDDELGEKEFRSVALRVKKCLQLEEWLCSEIEKVSGNLQGIVAYGDYYFAKSVAQRMDLPLYVLSDCKSDYRLLGDIEKTRHLYLAMKEQQELIVLQKQAVEKELEIARSKVERDEEYIHNLQEQITSQIIQLEYYKGMYMEQEKREEEYKSRIEEMEELSQKYVNLYKEELAKVDELRIKGLQEKSD